MNKIIDNLIISLENILGNENVITDKEKCEYYSQDVFDRGKKVSAIIKPSSINKLSQAIKLITENKIAIYPRGGGYSYTSSYLSTTEYGISLDFDNLKEILEINTKDMFVTVEPGCTWEELDNSLKKCDVRCEFWGPLSGYTATVGGGISHGAASLGSAKDGMSAEAVLSLDIIDSNGNIFSTGSASQENKSPFFRNYGPDFN